MERSDIDWSAATAPKGRKAESRKLKAEIKANDERRRAGSMERSDIDWSAATAPKGRKAESRKLK